MTQSGHSVDCEVQQVGAENQGFPYSTLQTAAHQPGQAYARAVVLGEEHDAGAFQRRLHPAHALDIAADRALGTLHALHRRQMDAGLLGQYPRRPACQF